MLTNTCEEEATQTDRTEENEEKTTTITDGSEGGNIAANGACKEDADIRRSLLPTVNHAFNGGENTLKVQLKSAIYSRGYLSVWVKIKYRISLNLSTPQDWIALYRFDERDPSRYLTKHNKPVSSSSVPSSSVQKGTIMWLVDYCNNERRIHDDPCGSHIDGRNGNLLCFRYYKGGKDFQCLAQSEPIDFEATYKLAAENAPAALVANDRGGKKVVLPGGGSSSCTGESDSELEIPAIGTPKPRRKLGWKLLRKKRTPSSAMSGARASDEGSDSGKTQMEFPTWNSHETAQKAKLTKLLAVGRGGASPPPVPPRNASVYEHRPLERTRAVCEGGGFAFEIIDTDEATKQSVTESSPGGEAEAAAMAASSLVINRGYEEGMGDIGNNGDVTGGVGSHKLLVRSDSMMEAGGGILTCPPTPTHRARRLFMKPNASPACSPFKSFSQTDSPLPVKRIVRLPSITDNNMFRRVDVLPDGAKLPPNWEARLDSHGRIFYIDHASCTTTWQRPSKNHSWKCSGHSPFYNNDLQRKQLDRRYQSIRRTITGGVCEGEECLWRPELMEECNGNFRHHRQLTNTDGRMENAGFENSALDFLTRSDFFIILRTNREAAEMYCENAGLKTMVSKVRKDKSYFDRFKNKTDFAKFVNSFADKHASLPDGWEIKLDSNRKTEPYLIWNDGRREEGGPSSDNASNGFHTSGGGGDEEEESEWDGGCFSRSRAPVPPPRPCHYAGVAIGREEGNDDDCGRSEVTEDENGEEALPVAYNDKVVAFLRQPNISDILRERHEAYATNKKLRGNINAVRVEGTVALDRLSHDVDLTILLSLFEHEIMSYIPPKPISLASREEGGRGESAAGNGGVAVAVAAGPSFTPPPRMAIGSEGCSSSSRGSGSCSGEMVIGHQQQHLQQASMKRNFETKLRNFYRKLESKGYGLGPTKLKFAVRREHLLEDAFNRIMSAKKKDLQKCKLLTLFDGEEGLDYGGPSREFFFLLSRQLFNPYYGLFEYSANDTYTVQISPMSTFVDHYQQWFRFAGRVLGLALVHQYLLDVFFTRPFYKALLKLPMCLGDLESLDGEFHQSLQWVQENDISQQALHLTFVVTEEMFGKLMERELKPGGKNITVTERNKKEYIERMTRWRLERGVSEQTECLVKGFYEVVDSRMVCTFDAQELELVIAGTVEIDVADWRAHTEYRSGYHDNHPVIRFFWATIEKFSNEQRLRLLQFVTGTSSVPYEGFSSLRGSNGPRKFCIEKWGNIDSLPRAHTCFNRLDLPPYHSADVLYEKLLWAVEETNTFSIE